MGVAIPIDDRNPAIVYSVGWGYGGVAQEFNRTTTWTQVAGTTAKLTFQGTNVGVYGTISPKGTYGPIPPVSSYSIDGGPPVMYSAVQTSAVQYNQQFFASSVLAEGTHTLTITNNLVSDRLFLDFILVGSNSTSASPVPVPPPVKQPVPPTTSSAPAIKPSTLAKAAPPVSSAPVVGATPSPSPSPLFNQTTPSPGGTIASDIGTSGAAKDKTNPGAVAAGVIVAIVMAVLLVVGVVLWRRRQKRRHAYDASDSTSFWRPLNETPTVPASIQPFPYSAPRPTEPPNMSQPYNGAAAPAYTASEYSASYGDPPYVHTQAQMSPNHGYIPPPSQYTPPSQIVNPPPDPY